MGEGQSLRSLGFRRGEVPRVAVTRCRRPHARLRVADRVLQMAP